MSSPNYREGDKPLSAETQEPAWFATLPDFAWLYVMQLWTPGGESRFGEMVCIEYRGTAEDLVASGAATADMLLINAPTGKRHKRLDSDGDRFGLTRIWRSTKEDTGEECPPYRYFYLRRYKPLALIDRLPGAREAMNALKRHTAWCESQRQTQDAKGALPRSLRLVVDNTRRPS